MIDLDYVQARLDKAGDVRHGFVLLPIEDGTGMVAELRAARDVVELNETMRDLLPPGVIQALDRYHQTVEAAP